MSLKNELNVKYAVIKIDKLDFYSSYRIEKFHPQITKY